MKGTEYSSVYFNKDIGNEGTEYSSVYFNATTKTVINSEFSYDKSFQEILYRIDNWINEGYGWIIKSINSKYDNISNYGPLIGGYFVALSSELKNQKRV